ncbi:response regulator [Desulfuromonas acetoxidans]|uniref:hybrid sensor histidine kinase/response regulator n=1 Tax=Desulfuromonas acetoxidans TaxID=891 RepID=UPI00292FC5CD|nr:response regulator [Desulfuromonas acetoxidans]
MPLKLFNPKSLVPRIAVSILLVVVFCGCSAAQTVYPQAQQGRFDLRGWSFGDQGAVPLNGQWAFYWDQLLSPTHFSQNQAESQRDYVTVPKLWSGHVTPEGQTLDTSGMATLRLTVRVDANQPLLALKITAMTAAYRLWLNDRLLAEQGIVGTNSQSEWPAFGRKTVSFQPPGDSFDLTLQLSNHNLIGGVVSHPRLVLGDAAQLSTAAEAERRHSAILLCVSLFMVVYHLALFLFYRRDRSTLYFALYCLLWLINGTITYVSSWLLSFTEIHNMVWIVYRCDLISYYLTIPLMVLFLRSLFRDEMPAAMPKLALLPALVFSGYVLLPESVGLHPLQGSSPQLYHLFTVLIIFWSAYGLLKAWQHKRSGAGLILAGFILMTMVGVNDMLFDIKVVNTGFFMPFGMLLFIVFQALALAQRFSNAFTTTERLSVELQEKNIALSRMDQLKDEFLANTSHELRTPLAGIIGIAESLLAGSGGQLSELARHNLHMVVSSSRRLTSLINDILDFTRLRNRDLPLNLKAVDVKAVADVVLSLLTPLAEAKQLTLVNQIDAALPCTHADEDRIQQIFYNLIGNAIKFSDQGEIVVTGQQVNGWLELSVRDQGIGIDADSLKTIFEPFEQADSGAGRASQGAGLGLAITRNLVQLHGGDLSVESQLGQGSTFCFTLPVSEWAAQTAASSIATLQPLSAPLPSSVLLPEHAAEEATPPQTQEEGDFSILVVDDEPVNLQVLVNQLHVARYRVRIANSGQQALDLVEEETPDLILLDIMMPHMTGYEVCQRLRRTYNAAQLPVIMLTARSRVSDVVQGFQAGANDYVAKPFSRDILLARVRTQLQLGRAYQTLAENMRLKKELEQRQQTELELSQTQRRLAQLLDSVDDMVITVNESREISFYNHSAAQLLGVDDDALLGHGLEDVFTKAWVEKLDTLSGCPHPGGNENGTACSLTRVDVVKADGHTQQVDVIATMLTLEDEALQTLILRVSQEIAPAPSPVTVNVIAAVNRHQQRLRGLENALNGLLPRLQSDAPEVVNEIRTLDQALADVEKNLYTSAENDRRRLAVQVMQLSIDYWYEVTDLGKVDLARESGIWKLYTDRNGYTRAQTLDKYLGEDTFPRRPRWKSISNTAVYVLAACTTPSPLRDRLENALAALRLQE